jgi:hypothetical protein
MSLGQYAAFTRPFEQDLEARVDDYIAQTKLSAACPRYRCTAAARRDIPKFYVAMAKQVVRLVTFTAIGNHDATKRCLYENWQGLRQRGTDGISSEPIDAGEC